MKLNSKLTGGLAWAGLVVVLAVPSADLLTGNKAGESAKTVSADTDTVHTADISGDKAQTPVSGAQGDDPVDAYISSGKKLPSYISDAPAAVASEKPATTTRLVVPTTGEPAKPATVPQVPQLSVAALPPKADEVAPVPYPASKRPAPPATEVASAGPVGTVPAVPATGGPTTGEPLIIDEDLVERRDEAVARVLEDDQPAAVSRPRVVEGDELEEWDSGSLAEYLERKGLMSDSERADVSDPDEGGFYLDEYPDNDRSRARVIRRLPRDPDFFFF